MEKEYMNMLKLYFGNSITIISTLLLGANIAYMLWGYLVLMIS